MVHLTNIMNLMGVLFHCNVIHNMTMWLQNVIVKGL